MDVDRLQSALLNEVAAARDLAALEEVRVSALGKKGRITSLTKGLGQLDPEARREVGARYNLLKQAVAEAIAARKAELEPAALDHRLLTERIDVTLPVRPEPEGRIHPVSQVTEEVIAIFG